MLSATQIADMRTTAALALPDTATISRMTRASDSAGGWTETWATAASGVACRIMPRYQVSSTEGPAAGTQEAVAQWTLTMPVGTDLRAGDRVVIATRTFEVYGLLSVGQAWRMGVRADVREVVA